MKIDLVGYLRDDWIRVNGWGFWWKDGRYHWLLFSERHGIGCFRLGRWAFGILRADDFPG